MSSRERAPAEMRIQLDNELRRMREIYVRVVCLVGRQESAGRVFGSVYDCEKWCADRQLVFMPSRLLPEGGFYLGTQQILDGGDDAVQAMMRESEESAQAAQAVERETQQRRSKRLLQ